jgi:NAD+ synthase (glutamine-hydrolysing)
MQLVKVAAAVANTTPLDWQTNQAHILAAIADARARGVSILCLPELCITGYGCEDAFHAAGTWRTAWAVLKEILPKTHGMVVSLGLPLLHQQALYNVACLAADGRIAGFAAKRHLAGDGIHYEPRWFKPWPAGEQAEIDLDGKSYPIGDLIFDCGGVRIGFEICEDAWASTRPGGELAAAGVDVILNPSASHFAFGKQAVRERLVLEGSRAFHASYVYTNLLGNEAGRAIYDGGALIASDGQLLAAGPRFSFGDWSVTTAVIDIDATRMNQARTASLLPEVGRNAPTRVRVDFRFPAIDPEPMAMAVPSWASGPHAKEEEFARAVGLGLFDYMRKSRTRGFVVSLSGGADSTTVAVLIALMVRLALDDLGPRRFQEKLGYFPELAAATNARALVRALLCCAYQSTRNSTPVTRAAAEAVAEALGAEFHLLDVDAIVEAYVRMVASAVGRELTWEKDDIALQNIQARVRAPGVWMLANLRGALLVATSNRSEAAVGYATMDGDTCGGLSPIAGIDKAFVRRWLTWYERIGPAGIGPLPALAAVNRQDPTAELRPPSEAQTDERDLMPYDVLDAIERAAIRDKRSPLEVWKVVSAEFPRHTRATLAVWVERFFRLFSRNQWKRERYAPSFHVDDENLDPKTWCRFPILSGGFERELAELRRAAGTSGRETPEDESGAGGDEGRGGREGARRSSSRAESTRGEG